MKKYRQFIYYLMMMTTDENNADDSTNNNPNDKAISQDVQPQQHVQQRPPRPFSSFQFAPNGVCISPSIFQVVSTTTTDSYKQQQQQPQSSSYFTMRNVPGEGDCMFLAVALASLTSLGLGANDYLLRAISQQTRAVVAQVLGESPPNTNLYISSSGQRRQRSKSRSSNSANDDDDNDDDDSPSSSPPNIVTTSKLLESATRQEGLIDTDDYLELLRKEGRDGGLYGGGPELAVLANILRRPIAIYEAATTATDDNDDNENDDNDIFPIVCKGVFGDGLFEDPCLDIPNSAVLAKGLQPGAYSWKLHILVLDVGGGNSGGEKHACVLLPQESSSSLDDDI